MNNKARISTVYVLSLLAALSVFGQERSTWRTANDIREGARGSAMGTVTDVDETRNRLEIQLDTDTYGRVTVEADSVATQFNGFGGVINGKPEIFTGSAGFANVREGDRIEVRGTGRGTAILTADTITLLGRSVEASQVGVGQTRPQTSVSTPTGVRTGTTPAETGTATRIVGTIRQINVADNRIVLETDRREILNIRTTSTTPVYYRGSVYRVSNLDAGDTVTIETYAPTANDREWRARSIEVTANVQDRGTGSTGPTTRVENTTGRITRLGASNDRLWINDGRNEIEVDLYRANDARGDKVQARDFRIGDSIEVTGSYAGNILRATTVRDVAGFSPDQVIIAPDRDDDEDIDDDGREYVTVSLSATVVESLQTSPTLVIRDRTSGRTINVRVTEDFVVRTKAGGYTTADKLKVNDALVVKAFRDEDGTHIAQTIRYR